MPIFAITMKNFRSHLLILALMCSMGCLGQRRLSVIDFETLEPVGGANAAGNGFAIEADSLGIITIPDSCRSLLFSHVNYESRLINLDEVRDTVFLLSKLLSVKEVVVFGKTPLVDDFKDLQSHMRPSKTELQMASIQSTNGNLFGLLKYLIPKKWKKSPKKKRKERLKEVLVEY
ncbi:MAG: hypothetical protein J6W19_11770 [Prevotella sp.]|nr:hypothetical protein [Prevotella sp.]